MALVDLQASTESLTALLSTATASLDLVNVRAEEAEVALGQAKVDYEKSMQEVTRAGEASATAQGASLRVAETRVEEAMTAQEGLTAQVVELETARDLVAKSSVQGEASEAALVQERDAALVNLVALEKETVRLKAALEISEAALAQSLVAAQAAEDESRVSAVKLAELQATLDKAEETKETLRGNIAKLEQDKAELLVLQVTATELAQQLQAEATDLQAVLATQIQQLTEEHAQISITLAAANKSASSSHEEHEGAMQTLRESCSEQVLELESRLKVAQLNNVTELERVELANTKLQALVDEAQAQIVKLESEVATPAGSDKVDRELEVRSLSTSSRDAHVSDALSRLRGSQKRVMRDAPLCKLNTRLRWSR